MNDYASFMAKAAALLGPRRLRVLVAEDYGDLSLIMDMYLKHMGFDVQTVSTGLQVLPKARRFLPHFLLLDIGLPGMSGYEVAAEIRADLALSKTVIIAISAYDFETTTERFRTARINHFCTKPVDLDKLIPLMLSCRN